MRYRIPILCLLLAASPVLADSAPVAALPGSAPSPESGVTEPWRPVREVAGVPVEARQTETGFHTHRAQVHVCTDLAALEDFVADPAHFTEWVAFTRSARLLERTNESAVYYVVSSTPWPLKDRDMVYRISRSPSAEGVRLSLTGLPDYSVPEDSAARIRSAAGEWQLLPGDKGIDVSYELYLDPGRVPRSLANQRLAAAVGQTLANLAARFPCDQG